MIDDKLLDKFNRIQDLSVSEEMLGAYLEGTLQGAELDAISKQISSDSNLSEILNETIETNDEDFEEVSPPWDIYEGDYGYWELGLPPVISEEELIKLDEISDVEIENNGIILESMAGKYQVYGESGENICDPIFIQQPDDHSCALRSQQIILRDFGIDIPFEDLEKIAIDNGVYTYQGTYTYDIGKVLELAGIGMHQVSGCSMHDLMNELAQGHRVIVSIDANELWYNNTGFGQLKNWADDVFGSQGGNHALIVAGVEVNPNDVNDIKVVLTDPGTGHLRVEYPADQFMDAWKDSHCFMVATNTPAPYQYDVSTGIEVPSNFAIQQHFNQFVIDNSFQLSPDLINIPSGYQPAFTEHLDMLGNISYESFKRDFDMQASTESIYDLEKSDDIFSHNGMSSDVTYLIESEFEDETKEEYCDDYEDSDVLDENFDDVDSNYDTY